MTRGLVLFVCGLTATSACSSTSKGFVDHGPVARDRVLFRDEFSGVDGLITNEDAFWSRTGVRRRTARWEMTSGSLFRANGVAYSGVPDGARPDPESKMHTDSAVFRLNTRERNFGDVLVGFDLRVDQLVVTARTPKVPNDGVHIWLRYQNQYHLYAMSVDRRDGEVTIKKKCPGGSQNGGTYYELAPPSRNHPIVLGTWGRVAAAAVNQRDGSVALTLYRDGQLVLVARDTGQGCAPIRTAGAVGLRGDNARFQFDNFVVTKP